MTVRVNAGYSRRKFNWRQIQRGSGYYVYNDVDVEVARFLTEQLHTIIEQKYGLGSVWSKHFAEKIIDEASEIVLDLSQEIATIRSEEDDED
jgi:hypothetical protein|tara:strand:- start:2755 stop:3030 length:276 start_codon:yes stop_codon:yes gene_type:complete